MSERVRPNLHLSVFVADGGVVRGDVSIGARSSVWFHAVVPGDEGPIRIGACSNVQDGAVVHSDMGLAVEIGDWVAIGHNAVVRGARIGDGVMIGMNATVMSGAVIGEGSIVGAATFVPYGTQFPPRSLLDGVPAKRVRELDPAEPHQARLACEMYLKVVEEYRARKWGIP